MRIDCTALASDDIVRLSTRTHALWRDTHIQPHLAVVVASDDPATLSYIEQKKKYAMKTGVVVSVYQHPTDSNAATIGDTLRFLANDSDIHAIILQLPLPRQMDTAPLIALIPQAKDVDGFTQLSPFRPPIALAVLKVLTYVHMKEHPHEKELGAWLQKKRVCIIGKGATGGAPVHAVLRERFSISPDVIDSATLRPEQILADSDIVISAVGKPGIVKATQLKKDVILIGIGMGKGSDGIMYGDYDPDEIETIASWYTPIPGGIGPLNVVSLLENVVTAAEKTSAPSRLA